MTSAERSQLDSQGYLVLVDFLAADYLAALIDRAEQLWSEEGCRAGSEFKQEEQTRRLANLVNKGEVFERLIAMRDVLGYVGHVLGGSFKLSSLNARSANPRSDWVQ